MSFCKTLLFTKAVCIRDNIVTKHWLGDVEPNAGPAIVIIVVGIESSSVNWYISVVYNVGQTGHFA